MDNLITKYFPVLPKTNESSPILKVDENNKQPIKFSEEDINIIFNEINNFEEEDNKDKPKNEFLNKKRKMKLMTIKKWQKSPKFIKYKKKEKTAGISNVNLSIMNYNILNPIYMKKMNREDLCTEYRMEKIIKEILDLSPDIFCLQEADIFIYKEYLSTDKLNKYNMLYGTNCGSSFINIIGFKKSKLKLKSFKNFSLLFLGKYSGNRGIMNIELEHIKTKKTVYIYNVHFPWKFEDDKLVLLKMIFEHIKENNKINSNIFIVGDFNAEPNSNTIKLFYYNQKIKATLDLNNKKCSAIIKENEGLFREIYKNFKFQSAYQNYSKFKIIPGDIKRHPLFTSRTKFYKRTIDYIFFSNKISLRKILKLPFEYQVDEEQYLPNKNFPSDHLKLFALFTIK